MLLFNSENVTLLDCKFYKNTAQNGGIASIQNSSIFLTNGSIELSSAIDGGAFYGSLNVIISISSIILNNNTGNGAIINCVNNCNISLLNSNLTNNSGLSQGNIIYVYQGNLNISNCVIFNNTAGSGITPDGTIIYSRKANTNIENSLFLQNTIYGKGCIFVYSGEESKNCSSTNNRFSTNTAILGSVFILEGFINTNFVGNVFEYNICTKKAVLSIIINGTSQIFNSSFFNNNGVKGGAIFVESNAVSTLSISEW